MAREEGADLLLSLFSWCSYRLCFFGDKTVGQKTSPASSLPAHLRDDCTEIGECAPTWAAVSGGELAASW